MSILKKLTKILQSLFCKKKETEKYKEVSVVWHKVEKGTSSWNDHAGGEAETMGDFTRLYAVKHDGEYLTSAIQTDPMPDGKFEVEARFKSGKNTFPAIWVKHYPKSYDKNDLYKDYYEMDLSEYYEDRDTTDTTYHCPASMRKDIKAESTKTPIIPNIWTKFACEWDEEHIAVYINGKKVREIKNEGDPALFPLNPEQRMFKIILSMQYGSNKWLQPYDLSELPLWMDVRNFKYWKKL